MILYYEHKEPKKVIIDENKLIIIKEALSSNVYHFTGIFAALKILSTNEMFCQSAKVGGGSDDVSDKLLSLAKDNHDLWSSFSDNNETIEQEELLRSLFETHSKIKDVPYNLKQEKTISEKMKELCNGEYRRMNNSVNEVYYLKDKYLEIVFYHDKKTDDRLLIGQSRMYLYYLSSYCNRELTLKFKTSDNDADLEYLLNN